MKRFILAVFLLAQSWAFSQSNVRITMFNPSAHEVRLTNLGNVSQNIGTHFLCNFPDYRQINGLEVISGSLNLTAGSSVTVIYPDAWLSHGEIGYYINNLFSTASSMKDYVEWGEGFHTRESLAVSNGYWGTGDFVIGTAPFTFTGTGSNYGVAFWTSVIAGCTEPGACNYDPQATLHNGTCDFATCSGCTYPEADNYDPAATIDNGTCLLSASCVGDLNGDGTIGTSDLLVFVGVYGSSCQ